VYKNIDACGLNVNQAINSRPGQAKIYARSWKNKTAVSRHNNLFQPQWHLATLEARCFFYKVELIY